MAVLTSSPQLKHHCVLYGNNNEVLHQCAHILLGQDTSIPLRDAENKLTHFQVSTVDVDVEHLNALGAVQAASAVFTF